MYILRGKEKTRGTCHFMDGKREERHQNHCILALYLCWHGENRHLSQLGGDNKEGLHFASPAGKGCRGTNQRGCGRSEGVYCSQHCGGGI